MTVSVEEVKQTATQLMAALLSNPHIYPQLRDQGGEGMMDHQLILAATNMAKDLLEHIEQTHNKTGESP